MGWREREGGREGERERDSLNCREHEWYGGVFMKMNARSFAIFPVLFPVLFLLYFRLASLTFF